MNGLEIFDRLAYGHVVFHRDHDAWDLLNAAGDVVAVLCPRLAHVSIAPVKAGKATPVPTGRRIPYGERVAWKIRSEDIELGRERLSELTQI